VAINATLGMLELDTATKIATTRITVLMFCSVIGMLVVVPISLSMTLQHVSQKRCRHERVKQEFDDVQRKLCGI
jgi:sensor domain CHASE-containing protein